MYQCRAGLRSGGVNLSSVCIPKKQIGACDCWGIVSRRRAVIVNRCHTRTSLLRPPHSFSITLLLRRRATMASTIILYQSPRTPKKFRRAREQASPLARRGVPLPPQLPSLRPWKDVCRARLAIQMERTAGIVPSLSEGGVSLACNGPASRKPATPDSEHAHTTAPAEANRGAKRKRKRDDAAAFELPPESDAWLQCVLQAGRECKRVRAARADGSEMGRRRLSE
ncbi:hypothetical protein FA95DRAFT_270601 [Auriscalpium vulgare]|uniref:Uncharacterized protein n=1 Tax=Auriscalpium vulgare TaxID=40419 RepID=A0ACB8S5Q0_9AGAM|nr:hypothetical protein FA95DRAFT_270601 [Auriscalpium vulgare]